MRIAALLFSLLLIPAFAMATHTEDFYVVPVVAHTAGVNGTSWMSDIAIYNFSPTPLTVQMIFIESGFDADNTVPIVPPTAFPATIPANGSAMIKDVLASTGMSATTGSLLIGGDQPFALTSRTYSMSPAGDTVGQTVHPVSDFIEAAPDAISGAARAHLPGLISNANFRTNIGFAAATANNGLGMTLEVTLRNAQGTVIGTRNFFVGGGTLMHLQFPVTSISQQQFDVGAADVRIVSGSGTVAPYASVVDNRTADAVYVPGSFDEADGRTTAASSDTAPLFRRIFDSLIAEQK